MSANHETDSTVENIKSWEVEWSSSVEEFDDYSKALDLFNVKSNQGEDTILYEIQKSKLDGSIVKRIPILNTKQSKKRKEELEKKGQNPIHQQKKQQAPIQNKNKIGDIKYRIIILVIIVIAFLILLYVLSQLVTSSNTLDSHFLLDYFINNNMDFDLFSYLSILLTNI
jgi:mRNA-degrading endonuclease RelE of RelBE toxin-antitoxin system